MKFFIQVASKIFNLPPPVCEIGSFQIPKGVANLRPYLPAPYVGVDIRHGPGVDVRGRIESLPLRGGSVGTVVSVATLEHIENPIKAFDEIYRVTSKGGTVILTSVFSFRIHDYPGDFWRFTPQCFNLLLKKFNPRIICALGPPLRPTWIMGLGIKGETCDVQHYQEKATLLYQDYLGLLSTLKSKNKETALIKTILKLPVINRYRHFLYEYLEMELRLTLYCNGSEFSLKSTV